MLFRAKYQKASTVVAVSLGTAGSFFGAFQRDAFAYMPRYVHVTLGVPWIAYLIFMLGVLTPLFLYLGVSWYWRHEIEANKLGKDDKTEE
ncbi:MULTISPECIES: hypothetical protein [Leptospirillum]|jgi:predicted membrane channel-forming protein YqfA (hemolysin III family)|uniref:Uncharacterized protein n=1 Tax=Leptospirillum ferriphilum TaxID=178606 RepID=A0A1V3SWT3_9BACT|nr:MULTISPECIES: hypothetical protein [Leptospirillum]EAY56736.1 MAG: hypothetical protein UBAL2_80490013 [Leptospirillum rubarum]EIJ76660.1 MAG: Hypothetical protein C75L2_00380025 [Leptospirillum sp. Group II 'C75']MCL4405764.1 hypothetical protein [Bacillota bacterium]MCL5259391.1 hypothetical protein [Nitrospirota bacterium]AKS24043.1 hypothetical protein ABH19_10325 [Leptospirillum sp. Group II 'CF-1']